MGGPPQKEEGRPFFFPLIRIKPVPLRYRRRTRREVVNDEDGWQATHPFPASPLKGEELWQEFGIR